MLSEVVEGIDGPNEPRTVEEVVEVEVEAEAAPDRSRVTPSAATERRASPKAALPNPRSGTARTVTPLVLRSRPILKPGVFQYPMSEGVNRAFNC
jgi:hypothetical protein